MITIDQIERLSKKYKTNTTVIAREYLQLVFLQNFYQIPGSEKIFFKGGTAIRFLMDGFRFSEDLDFTGEISEKKANDIVLKSVKNIQNSIPGLRIKEKKSIAGKTYLLTLEKGFLGFPIFVRLDFSFREKVLQKEKSIIETEFPVIFSSYVYCLGGEEMLAEKFRAILTRNKGRDLFDIWFLLAKDYKIRRDFISKKMDYYPKVEFSWKKALKKVESFSYDRFESDLKPFISIDKRAKIDEMFEIIKQKTKKSILNIKNKQRL